MANNSAKTRKEPSQRAVSATDRVNEKVHYPLSKINFIMMAVCLLMIVLGFWLMTGSANVGDKFNYDLFESRRTSVGPVLAFFGFVLMAFAIIWRKKPSTTTTQADETHEVVE